MDQLPANTEIFYTADGSPTLSFARPDGYKEKMHHSAGAVGESIFIYLDALRAQMRLQAESARVLSIGLGLGYNELLSLAEFKKAGVTDFKIWSFEALEPLRSGFAGWAAGSLSGEFKGVLDQVAAATAKAMELPIEDLRAIAKTSLTDGRLELRGPFPEDASGVQANVVFYDAYSRKMDPGLWEEDGLVNTFSRVLTPDCVLTTYAATGSLNRALKRLGFRPSAKTGFMGKRESTLAFRGRLG